MKKIIGLILVCISVYSCHDITVGYLNAENAVYVPDSLITRKEPVPDDFLRVEHNAPWVSPGIQGVMGTAPISYRITGVKAVGEGDAAAMQAVCAINGGGVISFPLENDIPVGRYLISIEVSNKGYSYVRNDIFTIILK